MQLTPVERHGEVFFKRDDLYSTGAATGGKARTCMALATGSKGIVTAGSRHSPQVALAALVARQLGIPCRAHIPAGPDTEEVKTAMAAGATIVRHSPGYNSVIVKRARDDADEWRKYGWVEIPFGMESPMAVAQTRQQVANLPRNITRIVVPVGSGMSLAGILHGMVDYRLEVPVVGVVVGADPSSRLKKYAPDAWWSLPVSFLPAEVPYSARVKNSVLYGIPLDPVYEAKCIPFIKPGDCLWIVGNRNAVA